ncbi:carboxylesterase [Hysterangium stoloniferum]|nr:carboxylesterase [Hysterangium stoloniferum]
MSPSVHCPSLSTTFVGIQHSLSGPACQIHQYRGIKYASIPGRFRRSQLHTSYTRTTDAKAHGPIAPQIKRFRPDESSFGLVREEPSPLIQDEFECLNLTITSPGLEVANGPLPVMIWIHGGDNLQDTGSSLLYDAGKLVRASIELSQPIIVVAINYRLGLLGFAASEDLEMENRRLGEQGVGNYALYDQLNAITWVRKHIVSFGGDPSNVTLFGQAAGAVNIHSLLMSRVNHHKPIAARAIIQSGVVSTACVPTVSSQTSTLARVMSSLNIRSVEELRRVPVDLLISHTAASMSATDDGIFFRDGWRECPVPEGVDGLIIGDCAFESALWTNSVSLWSSVGLVRRIRAVIRGVYKADALLRAYNISLTGEDEDSQDAALNFINDACFAWPADKVARGTQGHVYRYTFDQESPYTYTAHHAVDLLYLFDNAPAHIPARKAHPFDSSESDLGDSDSDGFDSDYFGSSDFAYNATRVCRAMQERWIAFAHGEHPWSPEKLYVFGPEGEIGERHLEDELSVRRRLCEWRQTLEMLPPELVHKLAIELSNGPRVSPRSHV